MTRQFPLHSKTSTQLFTLSNETNLEIFLRPINKILAPSNIKWIIKGTKLIPLCGMSSNDILSMIMEELQLIGVMVAIAAFCIAKIFENFNGFTKLN